MRILWISDSPNQATGYGVVTKNVVSKLAGEGFQVAVLGLQNFGQPLDYGNYKVFPRLRDNYAADVLRQYINEFKPDAVVTLGDLKMFGYLANFNFGDVKWVNYYPIDGVGMPLAYTHILNKASKRIAMSKHTKEETEKVGLDCGLIYHGVDTSVYNKKNKEEIKKTNNMGDKFIVGSVARNQMRKMFPRLLQAYKEFSKDKDDVLLLMHTTTYDESGNNLIDLFERFNLQNKVFISEKTSLAYGLNDDMMANVYNSFDVHALATCFHPKTYIQTKEGVKFIDEIEEGEKVLTKLGTLEEVDKVNIFDHAGESLEIKADGLPSITCTPNHRMFFVERKLKGSYGKKKTVREKKIVEKEARFIRKKDFVLFPVPKRDNEVSSLIINKNKYTKNGRNQFGATFKHPNAKGLPAKVKLDGDFGLLAGWFLSEGCTTKDGIALCFHTKEKEEYSLLNKLIKKLFLKTTTRLRHNTRNRTTLWVNNVALGRLFKDMFGQGAHSKKIPEWVKNAPLEFQEALLRGLWLGDGCYWKKNNNGGRTFELQTVSKQLAWTTFRLLIQLGFKPTLTSSQRENEVWKIRINGPQGFGNIVGIKEILPKQENYRIFRDENFVYYPVSKIIKREYVGMVYDLTVKNEHSYVTSFAGHNSGEGFGLPILESMSCGVPNVLTDVTTSKELIEGRGELAKVKTMIMGNDNIERGLVDVKDFADKLQVLYDDRKKLESYSKKCVEFSKQYDWSTIGKDWVKVLEGI